MPGGQGDQRIQVIREDRSRWLAGTENEGDRLDPAEERACVAAEGYGEAGCPAGGLIQFPGHLTDTLLTDQESGSVGDFPAEYPGEPGRHPGELEDAQVRGGVLAGVIIFGQGQSQPGYLYRVTADGQVLGEVIELSTLPGQQVREFDVARWERVQQGPGREVR